MLSSYVKHAPQSGVFKYFMMYSAYEFAKCLLKLLV